MSLEYDLAGRALLPLSELLAQGDLPLADFLPRDALASVFSSLYYTEASIYFDGANVVLDARLALEQELALGIPGSDAIALVVAPGGEGWTSIHARIVL